MLFRYTVIHWKGLKFGIEIRYKSWFHHTLAVLTLSKSHNFSDSVFKFFDAKSSILCIITAELQQ